MDNNVGDKTCCEDLESGGSISNNTSDSEIGYDELTYEDVRSVIQDALSEHEKEA